MGALVVLPSGSIPLASTEEALAIARLWHADAGKPVHVRDGENSIWEIDLGGRPAILRLTRETHRTRAQLEAELDFIDHVVEGGLSAAKALQSSAGPRIIDVSPLLLSDERAYAAAFVRCKGRHFQYHTADVDRPLFWLWGHTMGRLHALSQRFTPQPGRRRPDWLEDEVAGCDAGELAADDEVVTIRNQIVAWLHGQSADPRHYGMVHGDFERTNFLICDGSIHLFDFDDCCHHWYCWDIACALWVFRNEQREARQRFLGWFLDGYASAREPDTARLERFSDLVRLRTVALLLRRLHRTPAVGEDDAWVHRTRTWLRSPWEW